MKDGKMHYAELHNLYSSYNIRNMKTRRMSEASRTSGRYEKYVQNCRQKNLKERQNFEDL
jgi:hypothetical protein